MKVESFKTAARVAASDDHVSDTEMSNLRSAFEMMSPADREQALAFLLTENMSRTYATLKDMSGLTQNFTFDNFKSGVRAAKGDTDGISDRDLGNIRDAFSRLGHGDRQRALAFLGDENMPRTYQAVKDLASVNVRLDFDAFKTAMRKAANDDDGMTDRDLGNARDAFGRLSTLDQGLALEFLLADNMPRTYQAVSDLAGASVCLTFDAFKTGMRKAGNDDDRMTDRDLGNARDAFGRLSTFDQGLALEFLLADDMPKTYQSVSDLAGTGVRISLDAFKTGMRKTGNDDDGMTDRDLANARDAARRLPAHEKGPAAEFLLAENRQRTFAAVKEYL